MDIILEMSEIACMSSYYKTVVFKKKYYYIRQTQLLLISLFHRAFQFSKYNGPTNALEYNKTLI
jgi:hypothetical protein